MTGPRPAVGRVCKIASRAFRGGRRAMAALGRAQAESGVRAWGADWLSACRGPRELTQLSHVGHEDLTRMARN
jgi:hypothetical protein